MSEIRMDIDLEHPAERIWRALTEEKLLSQWLELPGFAPVSEAEVTGVEGQRRLAMLWGNDDLSTRLVWELTPTPDGATLTLRQSCVYGEWEDGEREDARAAYDGVLHERLPAILDWLAFQDVDLKVPTPSSAEPPTEVILFVPPADHRRRRGRLVVGLSTAVLVVVGIVTAAALTAGGGEQPAAAPQTGQPEPSPGTSAPAGVGRIGTGAPSPSPSASPSTSSTPSPTPTTAPPRQGTTAPAGQPVLGADYETSQRRLLGYEGTVVVRNTGEAAAPSWTVKITLRDGARVTDADGATFQQDDQTVVFSGGTLPAAQTAQFTFQVSGALEAGPTACEVAGKPCS